MMTLRQVALIISASLCLFFTYSTLATNVSKDETNRTIKQGETFLLRSLSNNTYTLACTSSSQAFPCPIHQMGEIVVGFFILQALADRNFIDLPHAISKKMVAQLEQDKKTTGPDVNSWGYAANAPADADDTSFGLQTLFLLGKKVELDGLEKFYSPTAHGYFAFINQEGLYPDVNANVFLLFQRLNLDSKVNYKLISDFQHREGYWDGHFYQGKFYTTYLAMKVLCQAKPSKEINNGIKFILDNQHSDGSWGEPGNPYDTALALNTLLECHQPLTPPITKGITYLMKRQRPDGSWLYEQPIWRCQYTEKGAKDVFWAGYDNNRAITTAFAVSALKRYREIGKMKNTETKPGRT